MINEEALDCLQALRDLIGKPLIVLSGYRSPEHNRRVGGARASKHMESSAFDISMANHDPVSFEAAARKAGFLGFGFYPRSEFMHIDLGPARSWGERFPARASRFVPEAFSAGGGVQGFDTAILSSIISDNIARGDRAFGGGVSAGYLDVLGGSVVSGNIAEGVLSAEGGGLRAFYTSPH